MSAAFLVVLLRVFIQKNLSLSDTLVSFLRNTFMLREREAIIISHALFLNHLDLLTFIGILTVVILLFKVSLNQLTKYFDEISQGMDMLLQDEGETIHLSSELEFMEKKLNQIKLNLDKEKRAALEAEQRKNDLVVYLAHDIKTPLTSVIGYLSLLEEAPDMPADQKAKYVGLTLDKAYRLESLINEFFEITRFNLQSIALLKETINLKFMLEQIADEFYPMLNPQGKCIETNVPEGVVIIADADKLARVFNNILKNAISYSRSGSLIHISTSVSDAEVTIKISNQGSNIPREKLETIFEKYFRLDASRSSQSGGAGLGLAIAKEIVLAHQGRIYAESEDNIVTFVVVLPQ